MRDNIENQPFGNFIWFMGVVEDIDDPLKINRVRVRCIGFHSDNRSEVATEDLPWAPMMNSTTNMSAPVLNQGDWVVGFFIDGAKAQQPVVLGSITGIPTGPADTTKGFYDPDGIFPRSGQINHGTNSPLARGELGIPTGVEAQPTNYEPPAQPVDETVPTEATPAPASSDLSTGSFIGDSIAFGTGGAAPQPKQVNATVGHSSKKIFEQYAGKAGPRFTVISMGSNDGPTGPTTQWATKLRESIVGKTGVVVWIIPYDRTIAKKIKDIATKFGDKSVDLTGFPSNENPPLHPKSYGALWKAVNAQIGNAVAPTTTASPTPSTTKTETPPSSNPPVGANLNAHESRLVEAAKKQGFGNDIINLAAFLANCRQETGNFVAFAENLSYSSEERIRHVFAGNENIKGTDVKPLVKNPQKLANRVYANKNGNRNEASGDGWKYRGKGYIQLTGRENYTKAQAGLNIPLLSNPDIVLNDLNISALTSAWWWKTYVYKVNRYKKEPPREIDKYIDGCSSVVNGRVPSHGNENRRKYFYEYLRKLRGTIDATAPVIETDTATGEIVTVTQPNYKTPSRQTDEDAITYTKRTAAAGILTASGLTWNEPASKYAAVYPYNHVMETAGGHVLEFDDTEGAERIHIFHKNGSFIEIHPDGKIVMRSNGSMNQITYGDGNFYIRGNCNISATGDINLLSNKSTNISTVGDVNWKVGGKFNLTSQGEAKIITSKLFLEGSEIRMNEGTAGIGAPTPVQELSVSSQSADIMSSGEGYEQNSRGVLDGNGEGLDETPYTPEQGGVVPNPGGSTDVKPTIVEWNGDLNMKISKYYKLKDLVKGVAIRGSRGISATDVVNNLTIIAQVILDPLRDAGLKFNINDGLRDPNSATGRGNPKSDHIVGCAVDLGPVGMSAYDQALKIHEIVGNRARQHLLEYTTNGPIGWNHIAIGAFGAKNPNGAKSGLPVATFMNHKNVFAPKTFKDYKNGRKG